MDLSAFVDLAGVAATGILFLLIGLSVVQLAILVERGIVMWKSRARRRTLRTLTELVAAGLARTADGPAAIEEVLRVRTSEGKLALERRLSFLATLGNNAPFIGLLGTVLGIMHAFANLSMAGGQVSAEVMSGISEALVSTGVGLMVALPAVIAFNTFQRIIKGRVVAAESLGGELLAALRAGEARQASGMALYDQAA